MEQWEGDSRGTAVMLIYTLSLNAEALLYHVFNVCNVFFMVARAPICVWSGPQTIQMVKFEH